MDKDKKPVAPKSAADGDAGSTPKAPAAAPAENTVPVEGGKRQYLIAPRRGVLAKQAAVTPMSAGDMNNAIGRLPGVEVVRVLAGHKNARMMSARPDEATDTYVVKVDPAHAQVLQATAPPEMIIEEDQSLGYGRKPDADAGAQLNPQSAFSTTSLRQVTIRVLGNDDEPVANTVVEIGADGFPAKGTTNAQGEVTLTVVQMAAGPVQSLSVRPPHTYWNCYLVGPTLASEQINIVKLTPL